MTKSPTINARLPRIESLVWAFTLALSLDAFVYMNTSADGFAASGTSRGWISPLQFGAQLACIALTVLVLRFRVKRIGLNDWLLVGVPVLCLASATWSVHPVETIKHTLQYLALSGFGLALYWRHGFAGSVTLFARVLVVLAGASLCAALLVPHLAVSYENHEGAWKGVFAHKNTLGATSALGVVLQLSVARIEGRWRVERFVSLSILAVTLIASTSITPAIAAIVAVGSAACWSRLHVPGKKGGEIKLLSLFACAVGTAWIASQSLSIDAVAQWLGKDADATGRVPMWAALWSDVRQSPYLGYGFGAYWPGHEANYFSVWRAVGFSATQAHNGYLELALAFGVVATIVLVLAIGTRLARYVSCASSLDMWNGAAISVFVVVVNLFETAIFSTAGGVWLAFLLLWIRTAENDRPKVRGR
jgi:exopolysaccharide production protein ExoQ